MTPEQFMELMKKKQEQLHAAIHVTIPIKIGVKAKNFFTDCFRRGQSPTGQTWQVTKRQLSGGKSADSQRGPLLSRRMHLMRSIENHPGDASVTITNPVPYAEVHNEGFDGTVSIPQHTRNLSLSNKRKGKKKTEGKTSTTVKAHSRHMRIPQRQFIGPSPRIDEIVKKELEDTINNIFKN